MGQYLLLQLFSRLKEATRREKNSKEAGTSERGKHRSKSGGKDFWRIGRIDTCKRKRGSCHKALKIRFRDKRGNQHK